MTRLLRVTGKKKNSVIKTQTTYSKKGSSFDIKAASLYSATIHADASSITVGFSNPNSGEILDIRQFALESNSQNIFDSLNSDTSLSNILKSATKTTFHPTSKSSTLIPSAFFDTNNFQNLVAEIIDLEEGETYMHSFIPEISSYLVFPLKKELEHQLQSEFGHVSIRHHFASLISTYKLYYSKENVESVFVQFHDKYFSLCLFDGKTITHFNTFDMLSFEDVIYYTYYTMNQYGFDIKESNIHIGGAFKQLEETHHAFQRYSSNIFQLKPNCCEELSPAEANSLINTIFDIQCG